MKNYTQLFALAVTFALFAVSAIAAPVNVNSATAEQIAEALKGIGERKAAAIVAYRQANGPFKSVQDLTAVRGIGDKTVESNKADIKLDASSDN